MGRRQSGGSGREKEKEGDDDVCGIGREKANAKMGEDANEDEHTVL